MDLINNTGVKLEIKNNKVKAVVDYDIFEDHCLDYLKPNELKAVPVRTKIPVQPLLDKLGLKLSGNAKSIFTQYSQESLEYSDHKTKYLFIEDCYNYLISCLFIDILDSTYCNKNPLVKAVIDVFLEGKDYIDLDTKLLVNAKSPNLNDNTEILPVSALINKVNPYKMQDDINKRRLEAAKRESKNKSSMVDNWKELGFSCKNHCETFFYTNRYLDLSYEGLEVGSLVVSPSMYE